MKKLGNIMAYAENHVIPLMRYADLGHRADHINHVIRRSIVFAETWNAMHPETEMQVDICMVYIIAAFHDLGLTVSDRADHHLVSAKMFLADDFCESVFSAEERKIIAEAIEDHRASLEGEPRSIYGKIVSQADRDTSASEFMKRMLVYRLNHRAQFPTLTAIVLDMQKYVTEKYGPNGCAMQKIWFDDHELTDFVHTIRSWCADRRVLTDMVNSMIAHNFAEI